MASGHEVQRLREQAATYREIGGLAAAQPEEVRARRTAAEQAYSNVVSRLGAEGTYGPNAPANTGDANASIFKTQDVTSQLEGPMYNLTAKQLKNHPTGIHPSGSIEKPTIQTQVVDQGNFQKQVEGSTQFRIMSQLTAEAEQLINRQGPLYDSMINNLQLPVLEGSAALARENTEEIRKAMQRGGSARRSAFEAIQKIRQQEKINSTKVQQLAQIRSSLDSWSRQNAKDVLEFGQNWASNLGGIRESYQNAMDKASELMLNQALPLVFTAEQNASAAERQAQAVHEQMQAEKSAKIGSWINGIVSVGSLALGAGFLGVPGLATLAAPISGAITAGLSPEEGAKQQTKAGIGLLQSGLGGLLGG